MDRTQAAPYEALLRAQQKALLDQIAQQRGGVVGRAEVAADRFGKPEDSRAQVATERDIDFALEEHEVAHLNAIEAALARIAAGTYGECTDCGVDIQPARLQANPQALRCIGCQEKLEQHRP